MNTHGVRINYGRHNGELFTRLPVSYLRWMVNEKSRMHDVARAELERRGSNLPEVELSGHAIDNASLRVRKIWHETKHGNEGLHTWLQRITLEARKYGERLDNGKISYMGMKLVITEGEEYPVLVTIMRA